MNLTNKLNTVEIVRKALREDIGRGDITTGVLVENNIIGTAVIKAKEEGVVAGLEVAKLTFKELDNSLEVKLLEEEGAKVSSNTYLAKIKGQVGSILTAERVVLNFLQRMSGIATKANYYQQLVADYEVRVVDTRKTMPGLRMLDKYAVRVGGGFNHRFGLDDAVLIKDNHLKLVGSIQNAVKKARANLPHTVQVEVEVEELAQVEEALKAGVDIIMLDNMELPVIKIAVKMINGEAIVEVSGEITADNIAEVAASGVDIISVGELTHSVEALDISLDLSEVD